MMSIRCIIVENILFIYFDIYFLSGIHNFYKYPTINGLHIDKQPQSLVQFIKWRLYPPVTTVALNENAARGANGETPIKTL